MAQSGAGSRRQTSTAGNVAMVGAGMFMTMVGVSALRGRSIFTSGMLRWVNAHRAEAVIAGVAATLVAEHAVNNLSKNLFADIGHSLPPYARKPANDLGKHTRGAWSNWENFQDSGPLGRAVNTVQMFLNFRRWGRAVQDIRRP